MNIYSENKTSSFTVLLPQKVILHGKWNVALAEVHYNHNFFNISTNQNFVHLTISENADKVNSSEIMNNITKLGEKIYDKVVYKKISITPGYYNDIHDVVSEINSEFKKNKYTSTDFLSLNKLNGRINVCRDRVNKNITEIYFSERLSMQLGFSPNDNIISYDTSPFATNIRFGIPDQMMIYTDIIEPCFIGHEKAYVLKIINTHTNALKFGDTCYKEFHHMHYMPLQKREFEAISIDIRDYKGEFMPFLHGVLTVKLHFKKQDEQTKN